MFDRQAKTAFIVACVMLLGAYAGFAWAVEALNIYLQKKPVELRSPLANISRTLGPWQAVGDDRVLDVAMVEELGTNKYLDRVYAPNGNLAEGALNVHLAYYTGIIDAVPHVPDRCFVAAGYEIAAMPDNLAVPLDTSAWQLDPHRTNLATGQPYPVVEYRSNVHGTRTVRLPLGDWSLRTTEFKDQRTADTRVYSGYLFIANGRATPSPERVRLLAFDRSQKYAYYCKVQFTAAGRGLTRERFLATSADLLDHLLPELMQRLPDWSEVERWDQAGSQRAGSEASDAR